MPGLWLAVALIVSIVAGDLAAQEPTNLERKGLFRRIFSNPQDRQMNFVPPGDNTTVQDVYMDRETDTISAHVQEKPEAVERRENDPYERYPHIPGYLTIKNTSQEDIDELIEKIYEAYEARIDRMDPPDLRSARLLAMGTVPNGFPTAWRGQVRNQVWGEQRSARGGLEDIYRRTLEHSNQVKVLRDLPLIRETGMQEADGEFDIETFFEGRTIRRNEPIGSSLTTGNNSRRFREHEEYLEGGFRKKFFTGAEATVSNRFSTLNNNSTFLTPQFQGSSEMVLSVVQPVLDGAGYHYNKSRIKLAKYDSRMASAEFVRQLQAHLIEVNRSYWALYYSRAYFILTHELVAETRDILSQLEQRSDLDALRSEVLRARASLEMRKAMLSRAEMAIRNSEERLRALVNDPDQDIGSNVELIPGTPPIMTRCLDDVRKVADDALRNRPEVQQGFDELRAAIVRRDMQKSHRLPTLNLVAEMMLGDIEPNEGVGHAWDNQFGDGTGYVLGFQFSQPWDNDTDRAKLLRSEIELRQQANQLRSTIDLVLLEAVVSYRELMTAYRDMQGRYSALQASREELRQLRARLEVDTEEEGGRTTASQLQLILDSMDRNQTAEELFLDSVVAYNAAFAALDRARGTFLRTENVEIERVRDSDETHPEEDLERLQIQKPVDITGKGGKTWEQYLPATGSPSADPIPDVPRHSMTELITPTVAATEKPERKGLFSGALSPKKKERGTPSAAANPVPAPSYPEPMEVGETAVETVEAAGFAPEAPRHAGEQAISEFATQSPTGAESITETLTFSSVKRDEARAIEAPAELPRSPEVIVRKVDSPGAAPPPASPAISVPSAGAKPAGTVVPAVSASSLAPAASARPVGN